MKEVLKDLFNKLNNKFFYIFLVGFLIIFITIYSLKQDNNPYDYINRMLQNNQAFILDIRQEEYAIPLPKILNFTHNYYKISLKKLKNSSFYIDTYKSIVVFSNKENELLEAIVLLRKKLRNDIYNGYYLNEDDKIG